MVLNRSGSMAGNENLEYRDKEGNQVDFDSPEIEVDCSSDVFPEDCPRPLEVTIGGCEDTVEFDAGDLNMESLGRILQVDVTVKNVCPHRRVALGVIVTELDDKDKEYKRGVKTVVIPAHNHPTCRDVTVRCLKFVLPEELDVSGRTDALCSRRRFRVRFIVHYIDHDFVCCEKRN